MAEDARLAFAHPEERSEATAEGPRDRISVRDYVVEVEIGAFQAERDMLQTLRFNIVVEVLPPPPDLDDNVDRILSYDKLTEAVTIELAAERLNLLETLAERIAARILAEPLAARVFVRIEKTDRGPFDLGVEIVRSAGEIQAIGGERMSPRVLFLAPGETGGIAERLEALSDMPLIVCVGAAVGRPQVETPGAQRRIDLLAIEQSAWELSSAEPRCVVAGSRTELEWALRNGQVSVWAPSRMVLDSVGAAPDLAEPVSLAAWLAEVLEARELVLVGAEPPSTSVPVRVMT
ncbi:dihydroneopterin aldolase [Pelagovum pacificum]|uniref:Diguanylate cyclase n=1 Tax=Pelagovum pacificum TaxID=2588711 RepID=A0A5C5GEI7_9RHOB|nr:dihydroneopterin aldolase [Pelagovum pacificum]QQA43721.1 dihydroneopterin aldolase [Pelagovum pacificum]TNY33148.1 diguanylate cyclase [Pelagovum pacificum]